MDGYKWAFRERPRQPSRSVEISFLKALLELLALNFTNWIVEPSELTLATFVGYSGDQESIRKSF